MINLENRTFDAYSSRRVSFIITTKNRAAYLRQALERARALIHPDDELIIIDGNSTDQTEQIVNDFADVVSVFVSEPDLSGAHALNKGILLAHGKYIKQLPDDDVIHPEAMEQAIRVLEAHPEVDLLVCGGTRQIDDLLSTVYVPPGTDYGKNIPAIFTYGACGTGFVTRRSAVARIGLLHPTNLIADKEFVLQAVRNGAGVRFCRINLYHHPILAHSVTVQYAHYIEKDSRYIYRHYYSMRHYYQARLHRTLLRYMPYRLLAQPPDVGALLRREGIKGTLGLALKVLRGKKIGPIFPEKAVEYIWDGGFS